MKEDGTSAVLINYRKSVKAMEFEASGLGIFVETHFDPKSAKSDGKNMLPIEDLDELISKLVRIKSSI